MKRSVTGFQPEKGFLAQQLRLIPQLAHEGMPAYELIEFDPVINSSNMRPSDWQKIANDIYDHCLEYDGFVVLHGTDTMAYTASALPLMLRGLNKSVIITGSQIPLAEVRNDARENLITALMLAADYQIPEVCILFGDQLLRGCRTTKISASSFDAFDSPNYPPLGTVGSRIHVFADRIRVSAPDIKLSVASIEPQEIATFRLFPGVSSAVLKNVLRQPLKALILESYGVGNGPANDPEFLAALAEATANGTVIVNCTQCRHGAVRQTNYATGSALGDAGAISGGDMTIEAAVAKLMYLFSQKTDVNDVIQAMQQNLVGELTETETREK